MQTKIFLVTLIVVSFGINAQNTFPSNGNVGIGTTTPSSSLEINKADSSIKIITDQSHQPFITLGMGQTDRWSLGSYEATNSQFARTFFIYEDHTGVNGSKGVRFAIKPDGNIGIGTTNPNATLQIGDSDNTGSPSSEVESRRLSLAPITHGGSDWFFTTRDNNPYANLDIGYSNNKALTLRHDGHIGMGVAYPNSKLHVRNGSGNATLIVQGKQDQNPGNYAELVLSTEYSTANTTSGTDNGRKTIIRSIAGGTWGQFPRLGFYTSSNMSNYPEERMTISSNGNVGIRTISPDMELTVKGKIHAEEVKIDLSVPAPDYVFKKDYKLRTIDEVEKFIKANNHLPEIPSAKEFEQNGVMQAEMDMNLLKKIEELTLYTIQQEKKIKMLQEENQELKSLTGRVSKIEQLLLESKK